MGQLPSFGPRWLPQGGAIVNNNRITMGVASQTRFSLEVGRCPAWNNVKPQQGHNDDRSNGNVAPSRTMPRWRHEIQFQMMRNVYRIRVTMSSKIWQWHRGEAASARVPSTSSRPASRSRSLHVAKAVAPETKRAAACSPSNQLRLRRAKIWPRFGGGDGSGMTSRFVLKSQADNQNNDNSESS